MAGVLEGDFVSDEDALAIDVAVQQAELAFRLGQDKEVLSSAQQPQHARPNQKQAEQLNDRDSVTAHHTRVEHLLTDLEDLGTIKDRRGKHRRRGLYVTDFSAAEWCQQQVAFALSARLPKELVETPAMQAGTEQHALLEAETALEQVNVAVATREAAFAMRLLNMAQGLKQLLMGGITRELPICGVLQGCWIWGIIDQLQLSEDGLITMVEQKTRFQPSLPSQSQRRTTAVQVMLYRKLFEQLAHTFNKETVIANLLALKLDANLQIETDVQAHAKACGLEAATLEQMAARLHVIVEALPRCSETMRVNYIWQGDGQLLAQEEVKFDQELLDTALTRHLRFWSGQAAPEKVPAVEQWKCQHCHFRAKCWPQALRRVPWQH